MVLSRPVHSTTSHPLRVTGLRSLLDERSTGWTVGELRDRRRGTDLRDARCLRLCCLGWLWQDEPRQWRRGLVSER